MAGFNLSRNQQLALIALVGISLIGIAYGRLKSNGIEPIRNTKVTVTKPTRNGGVEILPSSSKPQVVQNNLPAILVHVAGCVKNPSVYNMPPGSRIVDAIHVAGGPTADANLDAINLAERLKDGEQILVPSKRNNPLITAAPVATTPAGTTPTIQSSEIVNINTAGMAELDRLPGVGPVTAQNIIDYRTQIGRFTSVEQVEDVKGIGPKKLEKMRPYVRL